MLFFFISIYLSEFIPIQTYRERIKNTIFLVCKELSAKLRNLFAFECNSCLRLIHTPTFSSEFIQFYLVFFPFFFIWDIVFPVCIHLFCYLTFCIVSAEIIFLSFRLLGHLDAANKTYKKHHTIQVTPFQLNCKQFLYPSKT